MTGAYIAFVCSHWCKASATNSDPKLFRSWRSWCLAAVAVEDAHRLVKIPESRSRDKIYLPTRGAHNPMLVARMLLDEWRQILIDDG